jgi:hypothetical protein
MRKPMQLFQLSLFVGPFYFVSLCDFKEDANVIDPLSENDGNLQSSGEETLSVSTLDCDFH